jgi:hypothetical protein
MENAFNPLEPWDAYYKPQKPRNIKMFYLLIIGLLIIYIILRIYGLINSP